MRSKRAQRLLMVDGIRRNKTKRHSVATKQGIKKAKAQKVVVKKATLALRKSKKQEIVNQLFKATLVGLQSPSAAAGWPPLTARR